MPIRAVTMGDGFWAQRMRTNVEDSIPTLLALLEEHGVVDNFRRLSGRKNQGRRGPLYTDSDLYKWMEAVAFVLQSGDRPQLHETLDKIIDDVVAAQEPSGYLNTYYVGERAKLRFSEMYRSHELYCLGHLLQAGIAYYRATGNRKLLDGGIKYADYVLHTLGPEKKPAVTGHPEFEMALVELYRTTGDKRYLDFVNYLFTGEALRLQLSDEQVKYLFSGIPFTSRNELEGHAVRALYACSGATDYYLETGDVSYADTLDKLWKDLVERKMYITGGVGSYAEGESVGAAYDLPNQNAYAESCAAIANLMWNWRMLAAKADARYADIMEEADGPAVGCHQDVGRAVVIDIGLGGAARHEPVREAQRLPDVLKALAAFVVKREGQLRVSDLRLDAVDIGFDMPIGDEQVRTAIEVIIQEEDAE
jgi:DUF1680 family protein